MNYYKVDVALIPPCSNIITIGAYFLHMLIYYNKLMKIKNTLPWESNTLISRLVGIMLKLCVIILFRISLETSSLFSILFFLCL